MLWLFQKKKCICLSGLDGTGKTYLSTKIIEDIEKKIKIKHIWSRYRNYTSKPLLLITKLTGHNYKEIESAKYTGAINQRLAKIAFSNMFSISSFILFSFS